MIVNVKVPADARLLAEIVRVELPLPGAAMELGLKLAVTPDGIPDAESETAELNPPLVVTDIVALVELPWFRLNDAGEAETMKSAVACFHTSDMGVALAALPT